MGKMLSGIIKLEVGKGTIEKIHLTIKKNHQLIICRGNVYLHGLCSEIFHVKLLRGNFWKSHESQSISSALTEEMVMNLRGWFDSVPMAGVQIVTCRPLVI